MCGIAGVNLPDHAEDRQGKLTLMQEALMHRGPDAQGIWLAQEYGLGFAHTRLSILDLSDTGAQPMRCEATGSVLVYNGEIYNYVELRNYLMSCGVKSWRGTSDTEVLLALLVREGLAGLERVDGMFAFGFYDARAATLILGRDHLGEKPLYYALESGKIIGFASEARALIKAGLGGTQFDYQGLAQLLRKGSISPPHTHLKDIRLVRAGHAITISLTTNSWSETPYWTHPYRSRLVRPQGLAVGVDEENELKSIIRESFKRRMRADVPVGAFLSGGVDSSFVCARLIEAGISDLHTFTVVMPGQPGDESLQAREISKRLGTRHHEIPLDLNESLGWLEDALDAMDVPSVDGPNTWLVSRAVADQGFKVACSGLGGDELFYGYPSFSLASRIGGMLPFVSPAASLGMPISNWLVNYIANPKLGRILGALSEGADWASLWLMRRGIFSEHELCEFLTETTVSEAESYARHAIDTGDELARQTSALELQLYMHDQLLRDTDAMSMAHSLEVRVPLISRLIVEKVAQLSPDWLAGKSAKWFLKDWLAQDGLAGYFDRPKQGFTLNWSDIWRRYLTQHGSSHSDALFLEQMGAEHQKFLSGRHHYARSFCLEMVARQGLSNNF